MQTATATPTPTPQAKRDDIVCQIIVPATKLKPTKTFNVRARWILAAVIVFFAVDIGGDELKKYLRHAESDSFKTQMTELADTGHDAAALWLVKSYGKDEIFRLDSMVAKGNPEAIFLKGAHLYYAATDKAPALALINQAASQGVFEAIQFSKNHK